MADDFKTDGGSAHAGGHVRYEVFPCQLLAGLYENSYRVIGNSRVDAAHPSSYTASNRKPARFANAQNPERSVRVESDYSCVPKIDSHEGVPPGFVDFFASILSATKSCKCLYSSLPFFK